MENPFKLVRGLVKEATGDDDSRNKVFGYLLEESSDGKVALNWESAESRTGLSRRTIRRKILELCKMQAVEPNWTTKNMPGQLKNSTELSITNYRDLCTDLNGHILKCLGTQKKPTDLPTPPKKPNKTNVLKKNSKSAELLKKSPPHISGLFGKSLTPTPKIPLNNPQHYQPAALPLLAGTQKNDIPSLLEPLKKPKKTKKAPNKKEPAPGTHVWNAYCEAYGVRYKDPDGNPIEPPRNAKNASLCARLVKDLGVDTAIAVVMHYMKTSNYYYGTRGHDLPTCYKDSQKLYLEWRKGSKITRQDLKQEELADENTVMVSRYLTRKHGQT